ncbi:MAG: RidA family protein [Clostridia bacterium]|nr:RidA family protein [Clostridia bacterium]
MTKTLPEKYITEPTGYPFAPVLSIEGKEIVVTSGICCDDYDGTIPEDIETQARNTILACEAFLKEAGCDLTNVFNVEVYMEDLDKWGDFNKIYRELMPDNPFPCRKALEVKLLPGYQVELVMWAVK